MDTFHSEWGIRQGFLRKTEQWETNVIFPKSRPPLRAALIESNRQRSQNLDKDARVRLPDGRWLVAWEPRRPGLYENYVLQWQW